MLSVRKKKRGFYLLTGSMATNGPWLQGSSLEGLIMLSRIIGMSSWLESTERNPMFSREGIPLLILSLNMIMINKMGLRIMPPVIVQQSQSIPAMMNLGLQPLPQHVLISPSLPQTGQHCFPAYSATSKIHFSNRKSLDQKWVLFSFQLRVIKSNSFLNVLLLLT